MPNDLTANYDELKALVQNMGSHYFFRPATLDIRSLPLINLSFSSSGEDLWLRQFMKPRLRTGRPGFYVDIGANHPVSTSNSYLFYCMGWRGVCIDANIRFQEDFRSFRPRDVYVHAAISDLDVSLYFAEFMGAAGHKVARVMNNEGAFKEGFLPPVKVPAMRLAAVLQEHIPADTNIDFMTIDLEDSELAAIRSNDWSAFKPRVILIEAGTGFDPLSPYDFPTIAYLRAEGYRFEGSSNNNVLMTSPDFTDLT